MIIHQITLENFRNHRELTYTPASGVNIICGQNGRGKTNLLEAVYLLTGVKSWRTSSRQELVRWGASGARVSAKLESRGREFDIILDLPVSGKAAAKINGIKSGRENPLSGVLRAVLFSPDDLGLIKGSPSGRRELIDSALCQLFPRYASLLPRYSRLILSKGKLLRGAKEGRNSIEVLPEFNAQIANFGAKIVNFRAKFCQNLEEISSEIHLQVSGGVEALTMEYKTVSTISDPFAAEKEVESAILQRLSQLKEAEIASASCLVGPHRDDLEIFINQKPAKPFSSQGQARSAALALRFAQREIFARDLGEPPILLLDDILSELDENRRDFVCKSAKSGQCIITCCDPESGFDRPNLLSL